MALPIHPGDVLAGKYAVERVLGKGGMGVVVAAKHLHLGERVAIKFLLPEALGKGEVLARFLREGRAAARIKSEHVARVHDVGTLEEGSPYLVMEYLEGADLGAVLLDGGPLSVETAVEYVLQACEAVAEAHSLGIVHRDLKPANLFLTRRADDTPIVKVIDFGISKVAPPPEGGPEDADVGMTATSMMMGSPLYMAPEQMRSARSVDARADIFSFGGILYTLLSGSPPFPGQSVMHIYELLLEGPPSLRDRRPEVPESLDLAVQRCLLRDPDARFQNLAQLASAIAEAAPERARPSVERIARVLKVSASGGPSAPPPKTAQSSARPPAQGVSTSATEAGVGATNGSWEKSRTPVGRGGAGRLLLVIGAAVAGAGALAAWLALRGAGAPAAAPAADPIAITAPRAVEAPTAAAPAPPAVEPPPAPAATASQAASASGAPVGAGAAPAGAPPGATAAPRKPPAPPPRPPPPRDLFGDPR